MIVSLLYVTVGLRCDLGPCYPLELCSFPLKNQTKLSVQPIILNVAN